MLVAAQPAVVSGTTAQLQALAERDTDIDVLHGRIVEYLGRISTGELAQEESAEVMKLLQIVNHLEQIGDVIETNLVKIGHQRIEEGVVVSAATKTVIERYHQEVLRALRTAVKAVSEEDKVAALDVKEMKKEMAELAEITAKHEVSRLVVDEPNRLQTFSREMEMIENLSRIYRLCRKVARLVWT